MVELEFDKIRGELQGCSSTVEVHRKRLRNDLKRTSQAASKISLPADRCTHSSTKRVQCGMQNSITGASKKGI